jgi:hypothetical protein
MRPRSPKKMTATLVTRQRGSSARSNRSHRQAETLGIPIHVNLSIIEQSQKSIDGSSRGLGPQNLEPIAQIHSAP